MLAVAAVVHTLLEQPTVLVALAAAVMVGKQQVLLRQKMELMALQILVEAEVALADLVGLPVLMVPQADLALSSCPTP
jgi:hypothetical protein